MGLALRLLRQIQCARRPPTWVNDMCHLGRSRGIELEPGDIDRALDEMKRPERSFLKSSDLSGPPRRPVAARRISPLSSYSFS